MSYGFEHPSLAKPEPEPERDWLPPVHEEMERLRANNRDLLARIAVLEDLTARQAARIDELNLDRTRQTDRANGLADQLAAALNQLDRILVHAGVEPRPKTVRIRPVAGRFFPEAMPSGVTPAPTWANVFLVSVTVAAAVALLFGWLGVGR